MYVPFYIVASAWGTLGLHIDKRLLYSICREQFLWGLQTNRNAQISDCIFNYNVSTKV